ncbi:hypothetical protein VV089_22790 [Candidatus Merdisoma sp. JLR.KK011]|uniref:hypothetical protein n=1 Tax=Candidatus Merdisoma sp. JLR.KK011 TaxID=3114299 RepID=UPI002FEF7484
MRIEKRVKCVLLAVLACAAFLFLAEHFFCDRWGLQQYDSMWTKWQLDSEEWVVEKVIDARINGIGNYNGMMVEYQQQIGFAGMLFSVVDKLVDHNAEFTDPIPKDVMAGLNVLIFSALFFVLLYWLYRESGLWTAGVVYVTLLFTNWTAYSVRNIYWVTWTMLLPMIALLALMMWEQRYGKQKDVWLFALSFGTIFLRSACGYEFISCVMVALELPLIYYAVKEAWELRLYLKRALIAGIGAITGFLGALFVNLALMAGLRGWKEAVEYMIFISARRTGYVTLDSFDPDVIEAFDMPLFDVFKLYWGGDGDVPLFGSSYHLSLLIPLFFIPALLMLTALLVKEKKRRSVTGLRFQMETEERKTLGMILVMMVSFLGPASWLVLAKGHAVHHPHIDYIIFCLPFTMMGFAALAQIVKYQAMQVRDRYAEKKK